MGKRKTKKVEIKKSKVPKLDKEFNCPFCNNVKTVGVKMNHNEKLGHLSCRVCGIEYTSRIGKFDEAVDIYSNWIDKCCEVNNITSTNDQSIEDQGQMKATEDRNIVESIDQVNSKNKKKITFTMDENVNEDSIGDDYLDDEDDLKDFIIDANTKSESKDKQSSNQEIIEKMKRDMEVNKGRKIKEDSGLFDINNITKSSSISKSFTTYEEDDGLFSD